MFPDHGCHGEVALGPLPGDVEERLTHLPGEWLEFELETRRVVVRHAQPSTGPDLPVIVGELVQMLAEIPSEHHETIVGGDFFVHTYDTGQFVRLHVERGGVLRLQWARPDFARATRREYQGAADVTIDPPVQRLDGRVTFVADDADAAVARLQDLHDTFEGLYPAGELEAHFDTSMGRVELNLAALNLDAAALIETLHALARPATLDGRFRVTAFGRDVRPEEDLRVVFEKGRTFVQHPVLWPESTSA